MIAPVFPLLSASAAVTALVGAPPSCRVYGFGHVTLDANGAPPAYPYVTWQTISGAPQNELAGVPRVDAHLVQVDCWAETQSSVLAVAEAVRNAIEAAGHHMTGFGDMTRDPDTQSFRYRLDFQFWRNR